jgi:hypothetical protein
MRTVTGPCLGHSPQQRRHFVVHFFSFITHYGLLLPVSGAVALYGLAQRRAMNSP